MTGVVVDASVALAWCFPDEGSEYAEEVLFGLEAQTMRVPAIWASEVANGLLVGERRKRLTQREIGRFVTLLEAVSMVEDHQSVTDNVNKVLPLARKYGVSAYDAAYLELAMRCNAPLATLDRDLKGAARRAGIAVFS